MELIDVVKKLIGPVDPVGETNEDNRRYENLKAMTELTDRLIYIIDRVADNKNRVEFSIKRAGKYANKFMNDLGIIE